MLQGFFNLLVGRGVATTHETLPARAKGAARYHRHLLFEQKLLGKGFVVHAGDGDFWEGVKRAARFEGCQAQPVEFVDNQFAAAVVLGHHWH